MSQFSFHVPGVAFFLSAAKPFCVYTQNNCFFFRLAATQFVTFDFIWSVTVTAAKGKQTLVLCIYAARLSFGHSLLWGHDKQRGWISHRESLYTCGRGAFLNWEVTIENSFFLFENPISSLASAPGTQQLFLSSACVHTTASRRLCYWCFTTSNAVGHSWSKQEAAEKISQKSLNIVTHHQGWDWGSNIKRCVFYNTKETPILTQGCVQFQNNVLIIYKMTYWSVQHKMKWVISLYS